MRLGTRIFVLANRLPSPIFEAVLQHLSFFSFDVYGSFAEGAVTTRLYWKSP